MTEEAGGTGVDDPRRARRIEVGVYVFTAVALVLLGVLLTSLILNWIVGPAFVVVMVTMVTPWMLRRAGVADPDADSFERWRAAQDASDDRRGDT